MATTDTHVELEVSFLPPDQGGRPIPPWLDAHRYRPHLRVPPSDEMLGVEFIDGPSAQHPWAPLY